MMGIKGDKEASKNSIEGNLNGEENSKEIPNDARLLHLVLASLGITAYEDRVPLQLMDFAHRYAHSVLQDAAVYSDYSKSNTGSNSQITPEDIRLAVGARINYQFKPAPPKELLLELAAERNKRALPIIQAGYGLRLPPEKYCLTAKDWNLDDEPENNDSVIKNCSI